MSSESRSPDDFWEFYREYAKTGIHAASTAALTGFGLLTFVHRGFAILAIAVYVLPPVYLYLTSDRSPDRGSKAESGTTPNADATTDADEITSGTDEGALSADLPNADAESSRAAVGGADEPEEPVEPTETTGPAQSAELKDPEQLAQPVESEDPVKSDESDGLAGVDEPQEGADQGETDRGRPDAPPDWHSVDCPADGTLRGVVAVGGDAWAVGDGGVVLRRGPEGWEAAVDSGPGGESSDLRDADAADDGDAVWFCGDGGAVGRYDASTGRLVDHSAPRDVTSTWTAVATCGAADEGTVYLANGSGEVLRGRVDEGRVEWGTRTKPGSGSSVAAAACDHAGTVYLCDTNGSVFAVEAGRGESTFERVGSDLGDGTFVDIAAAEGVHAATDDGEVCRYDGAGWRVERVTDGALTGVAAAGDERLACGDGTVFEDVADGRGWVERTVTDAALFGVAVSESNPESGTGTGGALAVAVGSEGTVVERTCPDEAT